MTGNERLEWKGKEKEKRALEEVLTSKNEELAKLKTELDETDSRMKIESQYATDCKKQYQYLRKKLENYNWATKQDQINWFAAIKETERFVNEDRYENRFLGEVKELKDSKRFADNELRKEKERRRQAENAVERYEKRDQ